MYVKVSHLRYHTLVIAALLIFATSRILHAGESMSGVRDAEHIRYNLNWDLPVTAVAATGWILMEAVEGDIAPSRCRWCNVSGFDGWGHDNLMWSNRGAANKLSGIAVYLLAPITALGLHALAAHQEGQMKYLGVDALVVAESVAVSALFTQIMKVSVGRQRPDAHFKEARLTNSSNTSFYSGHTNLAFAIAVSSGTVASIRGYKIAPYIWGAGLALATTTAYLRVAADKHYMTDVIAGAAMGSAFGFCIPYFFHRNKGMARHRITLAPVSREGGMVLNISGIL